MPWSGVIMAWFVKIFSRWLSIRSERFAEKPYQINFLDTLNPTEPQVSQMLASLLSWKSKENRWPLLEGFLSILQIYHCPHKPVITAEKERIDVMVKDDGYAIIIENKIKGAQWQPNQLARYITLLEKEGYNTVNRPLYIIVLPSPGLNASSTDLSYTDDHIWQFAGRDFRSVMAPNVRIFSTKINDWINMSLPNVPESEIYLRSSMVQFADYANGLYTMRLDNQLMKELSKFIYDSLLSLITQEGSITIEKIDDIVRAVSDVSNEIITRTQWALRLELFRSELQHSVGAIQTVNISDRDESRPIYIYHQINNELFLSLMFDPEEQGKLIWTLGSHLKSVSSASLSKVDNLLHKASIIFCCSDNLLYLRYQYIEQGDAVNTFLYILETLKTIVQ